jgi:hypothetical protein
MEGDSHRRFGWKLKDLKAETKRWAKVLKACEVFALVTLEASIKDHMHSFMENTLTLEIESKLIEIESDRNKNPKILGGIVAH